MCLGGVAFTLFCVLSTGDDIDLAAAIYPTAGSSRTSPHDHQSRHLSGSWDLSFGKYCRWHKVCLDSHSEFKGSRMLPLFDQDRFSEADYVYVPFRQCSSMVRLTVFGSREINSILSVPSRLLHYIDSKITDELGCHDSCWESV